jgi:hypothetical protein
MTGAIPPLPQYAFIALCLVKAKGKLYLYLTLMYWSRMRISVFPYLKLLKYQPIFIQQTQIN